MPKRPKNALPTPKIVNGTQLGAYFGGARKTFGNHNDPDSWNKYHAFLREWTELQKATLASSSGGVDSEPPPFNTPCGTPQDSGASDPPTSLAPPLSPDSDPTVGDLIAAFLDDAIKTKSPSDYRNYKTAAEALYQHCNEGNFPAAEFDAYLLLQIQDRFCKVGYARTHCNKLVNFIIHIFRWGGVRRLAPAAKYLELKAISPVPYGKAKENPIRLDVALDVVERTLPYLLPVYRAIIMILLWTGARPSEIYRMTVGDIDQTTPEEWVYRPRFHKATRHKELSRNNLYIYVIFVVLMV